MPHYYIQNSCKFCAICPEHKPFSSLCVSFHCNECNTEERDHASSEYTHMFNSPEPFRKVNVVIAVAINIKTSTNVHLYPNLLLLDLLNKRKVYFFRISL